jgi:hypothetical protein
MSMSSGKVWFMVRRVTVTLLTGPLNPDTLMLEGYGVRRSGRRYPQRVCK